VTPIRFPQFKRPTRKNFLRYALLFLLLVVLLCWSLAALTLVAIRFIDPPTTAVHIERRMQAVFRGKPYHKRYSFVPLSQISPHLQHAVVAAEDARFYQHHGFDWHQIQIAADDDIEGRRMRGASTITQQLVKNLFFGTSRSLLRKGAEFTLVPVAEIVLGKQRILELYLNVVEWGPGIYGAEAASQFHFHKAAGELTADEAAHLAAVLPDPLKWSASRPDRYVAGRAAFIRVQMQDVSLASAACRDLRER